MGSSASEQSPTISSNSFKLRWLAAIVGVGFAFPLWIYVLIGLNMRYSGDDYCYAATFTQYGVLKSQWVAYQQINYYNGNRFSLNLFSALADLAGPYANGIWPMLTISVWLAGLIFVLGKIAEMTGARLPLLIRFIMGMVVIFFTLALTPDIDQSLFWRSGMLPYLAPILGNTFLVALFLSHAGRVQLNLGLASLSGLLALISAGFSETAGVVQVVWLSGAIFVLLLSYWIKPIARPGLSNLIILVGISWFATLVALALLAFSPTVTKMKPELAQMPDLVNVLTLSLTYGRRFLSTLKVDPLENILPVIIFAALVFLAPPVKERLPQTRLKWIIPALIGLAVLTYLLVVSSMIAFSFAQKAYPEPHAVIIPRFILTVIEAVAGYWLGLVAVDLACRLKISKLAIPVAGIALLACLAFPLWTGRVYWGELPRYQRWAEFWDRRDLELRQASSRGDLNVNVMAIDHIIPRVAELSDQPSGWYNRCAATYYHLETIVADLPGWDD
jgi:hypothetical protein